MSAGQPTPLFNWLVRHYVATYFLMVLLFLVFGLLSLDLVKYVSSNTSYLLNYGVEALLDGGLRQFIELCLTSLLAVLAYLGFKLCEHALVARAAHTHS
ncbi:MULTISPECIES: hypothetical protein [unclassified Undibacterium]|uniref:hypothetical protein n=1 Tax=unclassified Undibacterium TaxID=2630295 RepID=UPI002AC9014E|nr:MULTISPECIES: hypothetical protein [unclassified Undibacterium]MEB0140173.1 hypothetical protein [Undibacterium sp. CCC2.1]MEB0172453.1 hypothetical protein [Undibacterium sp. CCC1.1]MEB0176971.1 hypothetical protein [Undibacterium sp. CCC3.4]MEB0215575.1 hypothetical protein [Undibacterium sp. 5I2]WPX43718.1 hypothetical protein RHM61_00315 [Undibacterium sp. CCC3.4]